MRDDWRYKALNNSSHMVLLGSVTAVLWTACWNNTRLIFPYGTSFIHCTRDCFTHNDIIFHHVPLGWSWTAGLNHHRNIRQLSFTAAICDRREGRWSHRKSLKVKSLLCPGPYCANPEQRDFNEFLKIIVLWYLYQQLWEPPSSPVPSGIKSRIWAQNE